MNNISVTQIINNFKKFDREFWLAYKALEAVMDPMLFDECKTLLLKSKRVDASILEKVDVKAYNLKKDEIDAEWKAENEESKRLGTEIHELIRLKLASNADEAKKEFGITGELLDTELLIAESGVFVEKRLELEIDSFNMIGVPDVIQIEDGVVNLIDWKTAKKGIKFKSHYDMALNQNKKMLYPLSAIDDVNGQHYTLQLSLYMWMILQIRPDLKPGKLKISWVQDGRIKKNFEVPYMKAEVENLVKWYIRDLKTKEEMKKCNTLQF